MLVFVVVYVDVVVVCCRVVMVDVGSCDIHRPLLFAGRVAHVSCMGVGGCPCWFPV